MVLIGKGRHQVDLKDAKTGKGRHDSKYCIVYIQGSGTSE